MEDIIKTLPEDLQLVVRQGLEKNDRNKKKNVEENLLIAKKSSKPEVKELSLVNENNKLCKKCNTSKSLEEFYKDKREKDSY